MSLKNLTPSKQSKLKQFWNKKIFKLSFKWLVQPPSAWRFESQIFKLSFKWLVRPPSAWSLWLESLATLPLSATGIWSGVPKMANSPVFEALRYLVFMTPLRTSRTFDVWSFCKLKHVIVLWVDVMINSPMILIFSVHLCKWVRV